MYGSKLVVAVELPDGSIDSRYVQPLNEFLYEKPSLDIIKSARGLELLDILTEDLGIVSVNYNKLQFNYIKAGQRKNENVRPEVMCLLGRLAEALIVRRCHQDPEKNRLWGRYARRGIQSTGSGVETLDRYLAVGTGLVSTKSHSAYQTKYNPNDTQRDIIWVNKDNTKKELPRSGSSRDGYHPAGLQIKVSRNKKNVYRTLCKKKEYGVPVVYFDLKRDFEWVAEKLRQDTEIFNKTRWEIGVDLICGRSVDPELHNILSEFFHLLEAVLSGRLELLGLLEELPEVATAVTMRFAETTRLCNTQQYLSQPVQILTLPT